MSSQDSGFRCPLCTFVDESEYVFQLHFEAVHPFRDDSSSSSPIRHESGSSRNHPILDNEPTSASSHVELGHYVECPDTACGESMPEVELRSHMDMHLAEKMTFDDHEPQSFRSKQAFKEHHNLFENPRGSTSRHSTRDRRINDKMSESSESREASPARHTRLQNLQGLFSSSSTSKSQQKSLAISDSQIKRLGVSALTFSSNSS
jgi:hypothetical protein